MIEIYLPFPPSNNNYYVKTSRGVFISQKGRKFRADIAEVLIQQLGPDWAPLDHKLCIEYILFPPDKRKRDIGNYSKALLDSLTEAGLWEDDSLIDQEFIYRGVVKGRTHSGVTMRIYEAAPVLETFPADPRG